MKPSSDGFSSTKKRDAITTVGDIRTSITVMHHAVLNP